MMPSTVTPSPQELGPAPDSRPRTQTLWGGTMMSMGAEALAAPSGLLVAALLTRALPLGDYGAFTLSITLVVWLQWTLVALLARPTIKLISEAKGTQSRDLSAFVLQMHLGLGVLAFAGLFALAPVLARILNNTDLTLTLRVLALDVPLFLLAQAHRNIAVGSGDFRARAAISAARWLLRPPAVMIPVLLGWGVTGALAGAVLTSLLEVGVCRLLVRSPWRAAPVPSSVRRALWSLAAPVLLAALVLRLFEKVDLFALSSLLPAQQSIEVAHLASGAPWTQLSGAQAAALYGAAQNLALVPALFSLSFAPLLLGTLSRAYGDAQVDTIAATQRTALRALGLVALLIAPIIANASELMALFFGEPFAVAGPLLQMLLVAGVAVAVLTVFNAMLTAAGFAALDAALLFPILPLALLGHWLVIPRYGAPGAALITATVAVAATLWCALAVARRVDVVFPWATLTRCALLGIALIALNTLWPLHGLGILFKIVTLWCLGVGALLASGELDVAERAVLLQKAREWRARRRDEEEVLPPTS